MSDTEVRQAGIDIAALQRDVNAFKRVLQALPGKVTLKGDISVKSAGVEYDGGIFIPLTTPLKSTSWDGDAYSTKAKTLIDLSSVFSAPAGIKAVLIALTIRDSGSASSDRWFLLSPNDTNFQGLGVTALPVNDRFSRYSMTVPCNVDGDIYYQLSASGAGTMDVYVEIWGYWL